MTGKYTIHAVDPAETPWEVCVTDHAESALEILDCLRTVNPDNRVYWLTLTDDPKREDIEMELEAEASDLHVKGGDF